MGLNPKEQPTRMLLLYNYRNNSGTGYEFDLRLKIAANID